MIPSEDSVLCERRRFARQPVLVDLFARPPVFAPAFLSPRSEQISSQAELARRLAAEGIVVSQGTLSRDLKDVGAARGRDQLGNFQYSIPEGEHPSQMTTGLPARNHLARMCHSLCIAVNYNNGAVVIKTPPGAAQYLGSAIDTSGVRTVLGTIAGDDTVLVGRDPDRPCASLLAQRGGLDDLAKRQYVQRRAA